MSSVGIWQTLLCSAYFICPLIFQAFIDNINYKVDKQELGFLLLFAFWSTSDYYKYRIKPSKIFVSFVYPNLSI